MLQRALVVLFLAAASINQRVVVLGVSMKEGGGISSVKVETTLSNETPEQRARRVCEGGHFDVAPKSWEPKLRESCYKVVLENGHSFVESFYHNLPRALFLLLPIMALAMRLMYWRRCYVEHLLFFIHNHAFTFLLFTAFTLAMAITSRGWLIAPYILVVLFYPPIYTYLAMRRVYAQGKWVTRLKFLVLACVYFVFVFALAAFTSLYSLLTL